MKESIDNTRVLKQGDSKHPVPFIFYGGKLLKPILPSALKSSVYISGSHKKWFMFIRLIQHNLYYVNVALPNSLDYAWELRIQQMIKSIF